MCGIFSVLNNNNVHNQSIINDAFYKGQKRGPEYSELKIIDETLLLGFHRLAINGLDDISNQPMVIDGITLICNGEIYNYKELFLFIGITPSTNSDCEVIIHLYKQFGIDYLLGLLDGVFSFILHDSINNTVYIARDPYGVRPLYMLENKINNIYAFASELKVLSVLLNNDGEKITHILPGSYMMFIKNNIKDEKLDEGEDLNLSSSNKSLWKLSPTCSNGIKYTTKQAFSNQLLSHDLLSDNMIYSNICNKLINAVKKRVIGTCDRPIACLLSGGLDSSLIAALVSKFYKGTLETYSIGMEGSEDLKYAKIAADHIGTNHTSVIVTEKDFFNAIPEVIGAIESYDTTTVRASVGNYLIGKYISENSDAKVIFNGDGSDELTGGYLYFHKSPSHLDFDNECKRLLTDIYAFDILRSDKCISSHGLEPRTPFLDRGWVDYYLSIPITVRRQGEGQIEKYLLRSAFGLCEPGLLPNNILWRKKEAFSDGVSGTHNSWFEIICKKLESFELPFDKTYTVNAPKTKEQMYYRRIYDELYPNTAEIVPYFWMPRFINATDPSARTLSIYNNLV